MRDAVGLEQRLPFPSINLSANLNWGDKETHEKDLAGTQSVGIIGDKDQHRAGALACVDLDLPVDVLEAVEREVHHFGGRTQPWLGTDDIWAQTQKTRLFLFNSKFLEAR